MPNISDSLMLTKFLNALKHCEARVDDMSSWEETFVTDLRDRFENNESLIDMGITPWNPSANQWNTLMILKEGYP